MRCICGFLALCCNLGFMAPAAHAQGAGVVDDDVDQLVEHLVGILRERQVGHDVIYVNGTIRVESTGERLAVGARAYTGSVIRNLPRKVIFRTLDGLQFEVRREHIDRLDRGGHVRGESAALYAHGGRSALATLALLSAGVGRYDPTVSSGLEYLKNHYMPGTYGRALRASIYSLLVQQPTNEEDREAIYKLLKRDARWLVLAMLENGGYTYNTDEDSEQGRRSNRRYDNSNTQFGNLGVWISALAGYKVNPGYWESVARHWLSDQNRNGGWGYRAKQSPTQNMTIAGINSLVIVLDQLFAKSAGRYVKFEGIPKNQRVLERVQEIRAAIARGRHFLATKTRPYGEAYTQLGLERLGLASGQKYIGASDWYRAGAERAMEISGWENRSVENISMWLLFLAYGRAPVLFNKLKWGDAESGWDYYYRDMYHVCRYLSNHYEQLYKWQIIDTAASDADLHDAPFLYIAGDTRFWLTPAATSKIEEYVHRGGTVIGHANLASKLFSSSFKSAFEKMFSEQKTTFRQLSIDHPLYSAVTSKSATEFAVPIWALSDGYREIVLLLPVDVAGAWHQSLDQRYEEFFRLMANVRFYAANPYQDLPGRLRADPLAGAAAAPRGTLRVARAATEADRGGAPRSWEIIGELTSHYYGVDIDIVRNVPLADIDDVATLDLVHIAGQGKHTFTADEMNAIVRYCRQGGLVFVEAIGGDGAFAGSAKRQLSAAFGDAFGALDATSRIIAGNFSRGKPLRNMVYTPSARRRMTAYSTHPLLWGMNTRGLTSLVFSGLDVSVAASNQYVRTLRGYDTGSAQKILRNVVLKRFSDLQSSGRIVPPTQDGD